MNLSIINRQRAQKINIRSFRQILETLMTELKIVDAELGITLVSAKEMARINWDYLQHAGSTDVITFDHSEPKPRQKKYLLTLHGELFICVEEAMLQAGLFHTRWESELIRYAVHGVLHLLGYDDLKPHLRRTMKREENRLVRRLEKRFLLAELSSRRNISP